MTDPRETFGITDIDREIKGPCETKTATGVCGGDVFTSYRGIGYCVEHLYLCVNVQEREQRKAQAAPFWHNQIGKGKTLTRASLAILTHPPRTAGHQNIVLHVKVPSATTRQARKAQARKQRWEGTPTMIA